MRDEQDRGERRVLMPEIIGAVLRLARTDLDVTQAAVAERMQLPQSTVSKLERGAITHSVYHLDLFAQAINEEADVAGIDGERWEGWELFREADAVADMLEEEDGLVAYWRSARQVEGDDRYLRGRSLFRAMRRCWRQR